MNQNFWEQKMVKKEGEFLKYIQGKKRNCLAFGKPFLAFVLIYLTGISALLRANINYRDDRKRVLLGSAGWDNFSRYTSQFLSGFLHGSTCLSDISPLPQILAVLIMAGASVILLYAVLGDKKWNIWSVIAVVPLGLSPYFLQCYSYKYDAPYMALAVFGALAPVLVCNAKKVQYCIAVFFGTLLMCTTYQAANGIFPMLVLLFCVKKWNEGQKIKEWIGFLGSSVLGYGNGMLFFKFFLLSHETNTYRSAEMVSPDAMIPTFLRNLKKMIRMWNRDFKHFWMILVLLLVISYIFVMVRDSRQQKYLAFVVAVCSVVGMFLCSFGAYLFLEKAMKQPRAMMGIGAFLAMLGITVMSAKRMYPAKWVVLALSWVFFVFSFTYGNAVQQQARWETFRINMMLEDLNDLEQMKNDAQPKEVYLRGSVGYAPELRNKVENYRMLKRLCCVTLKANYGWGKFEFYHYYGLEEHNVQMQVMKSEGESQPPKKLPVLKEGMYHTIRGDESHIVVKLK